MKTIKDVSTVCHGVSFLFLFGISAADVFLTFVQKVLCGRWNLEVFPCGRLGCIVSNKIPSAFY